MVTIYDLKPAFQALLRPITRQLASRGITANQVTLAAAALSIATGFLIYFLLPWRLPMLLVPIVLFVRMALNAIDGMLAREHQMKSSLGAFLNELGDVISDAALYFPLAAVTGWSWLPGFWLVVLAISSEMTGVLAVGLGASRRYDGPMGKSDRAFWLGATYLLLVVLFGADVWLPIILLVVDVLLVMTIRNRLHHALREIAQPVSS